MKIVSKAGSSLSVRGSIPISMAREFRFRLRSSSALLVVPSAPFRFVKRFSGSPHPGLAATPKPSFPSGVKFPESVASNAGPLISPRTFPHMRLLSNLMA